MGLMIAEAGLTHLHYPVMAVVFIQNPLQSIDHQNFCDGHDNIVARELSYPVRTPEGDRHFVESCNSLIAAVFYS